MIVGLGTDIVEVARITAILSRRGDAFKARTFTPDEIRVGDTRGEAGPTYYAGRWAAKEAASKALGCGISAQCSLNEIEILNDPATGAPRLTFSGHALETARELGVNRIFVSISHEVHYAAATVCLEK